MWVDKLNGVWLGISGIYSKPIKQPTIIYYVIYVTRGVKLFAQNLFLLSINYKVWFSFPLTF